MDSCGGKKDRKKKVQRSLQQEFSFYWLNLSLQEDSCIAKTEPDTSSSAVVIYSLKLHQKSCCVEICHWTVKTLELHYNTLRYGWGEEAAATDSDVARKEEGRWRGSVGRLPKVRCPQLQRIHRTKMFILILCCPVVASQGKNPPGWNYTENHLVSLVYLS